jgi:hypothetical protein
VTVNRLVFSATAEIVSELQMISDTKSRDEMLGKVPKDLGVATCIGCGLELAIQVCFSFEYLNRHY